MGKGSGEAKRLEKAMQMRPESLGKVKYVGKITMDELKKHRTPADAWLLVKGKVIDYVVISALLDFQAPWFFSST
jgi:cytochrome b involved in lipid metabolism